MKGRRNGERVREHGIGFPHCTMPLFQLAPKMFQAGKNYCNVRTASRKRFERKKEILRGDKSFSGTILLNKEWLLDGLPEQSAKKEKRSQYISNPKQIDINPSKII